MTESFNVSGTKGEKPNKPSFKVLKIERGTDDGNYGSCSDAGVLTLFQNKPYDENEGYKFEVVAGTFEDSIFPEIPVRAVPHLEQDHLYKFVWLDGSNKYQEPIDIKVKITAVSRSGIESDPSYLNVIHPGVKSSLLKWWE